MSSCARVSSRSTNSTKNEEDLLDRAWGLEPQSRLSCQAILAQADVVVEIPRYTINHAKENH
jgi:2Fe-2S ferredoxin